MLENDNDNSYNSFAVPTSIRVFYNQTSRALTATVAKGGTAELSDEEI